MISLWRRAPSFDQSSLYTRIFCIKFGQNCPSGSGRGRWTYEKFTTTNTTENEKKFDQKRKKIKSDNSVSFDTRWRSILKKKYIMSIYWSVDCDDGVLKFVDEVHISFHGLEQPDIFSYNVSNISNECFVLPRTKTLSILMIKWIILKKSICNLSVYTTIDERPTVP